MKRIFACLLLFTILSCSKTIDSGIPYRRVYLELDLTNQDWKLKEAQAYKIFTQQNIDLAGELTGFGGVLVYHGLSSTGSNDAYYAFDAACPNEAQSNITVEVDDAHIYAICPKCSSKYELLNGFGNPVSGPSERGLQRYSVSMIGNKIYIQY